MKNPKEAVAAAARWAPHEACGITLDGYAIPLRNTSSKPTETFAVSSKDLAEALRAGNGASWDGVWHSHPGGHTEPSEDDLAWHPPGKALYIVAGSQVFEYDAEGTLLGVLDG